MDSQRHVHLNVNRSRISILGFTLSLIVFAIGIVMGIQGEHLPGIVSWYRPVIATCLLVGLSLCLISLWLCLVAQRLKTEAKSGLRRFLFAELLMYLALSQVLFALTRITKRRVRSTFRAYLSRHFHLGSDDLCCSFACRVEKPLKEN